MNLSAILPIFSTIAGTLLVLGLLYGRRWIWTKFRRKADGLTRCRCGYALDALDTIRCPECGRVRDFDATAEQLGLTTEQLQLAKAKRDARQRAAAAPLSIQPDAHAR